MLPPAGTGGIGKGWGNAVALIRMFPDDAKASGMSVSVSAVSSNAVMILALVFCIFILSPIFCFSRTLISSILLFMPSVNN